MPTTDTDSPGFVFLAIALLCLWCVALAPALFTRLLILGKPMARGWAKACAFMFLVCGMTLTLLAEKAAWEPAEPKASAHPAFWGFAALVSFWILTKRNRGATHDPATSAPPPDSQHDR